MGTKGTVLCDWRSCGICHIVKSGFERVAFGSSGNKGRLVQCVVVTQPHPSTLNFVHAFQTWRWPVFFFGSLRGGPICYFMFEFTVSSYDCLRRRPTTESEQKQFGLSSPTSNLRFLMEWTDSDGGQSRGAGFRNYYSEIHCHVH